MLNQLWSWYSEACLGLSSDLLLTLLPEDFQIAGVAETPLKRRCS